MEYLDAHAPSSEYSMSFLQGMMNRMTVSYHKYGLVADAYPHTISAIESMLQRLQVYKDTGNTEFLIDVANFAMIEFMHPSLSNAHYAPTDSDESPGRVSTKGIPTHESNTSTRDFLYRRDGD